MLKRLLNFKLSSLSPFSKTETIAIYVQHPIADLECAQALGQVCKKKYKIKYINHQKLTKKALEKVDCLAFPGGLGDSDNFDRLLKDKKNLIKEYVESGGKYLGVCMGAYLAGYHYFDLLKNADTVQYIKRKGSEVSNERRIVIPIKWKRKIYKMFFYDGCAIVGDKKFFKTIATYKNKDCMAMIQGNVGLIGCHPESPKEWYDQIQLQKMWNDGKNHELLLDFISELMNN